MPLINWPLWSHKKVKYLPSNLDCWPFFFSNSKSIKLSHQQVLNFLKCCIVVTFSLGKTLFLLKLQIFNEAILGMYNITSGEGKNFEHYTKLFPFIPQKTPKMLLFVSFYSSWLHLFVKCSRKMKQFVEKKISNLNGKHLIVRKSKVLSPLPAPKNVSVIIFFLNDHRH